MVTSDILLDAVKDMEQRCEVLRTSISMMQEIEGIDVNASSLLTDAFLHIRDAEMCAQRALARQIISESNAERTAPVRQFQKSENDQTKLPY